MGDDDHILYAGLEKSDYSEKSAQLGIFQSDTTLKVTRRSGVRHREWTTNAEDGYKESIRLRGAVTVRVIISVITFVIVAVVAGTTITTRRPRPGPSAR
ncbi:hypothetical protein EVAR_82128_1 [Eumeta japonica]|uniref:Uncharacterized protein n=1 Tax=Eumeta variegata TaxID=151549 RepID=A0A4C1U1M7_EUMVA|nr:hypothetical protein EVAR_82128_1 [Eumeta japonica]